MSSYISIFTFDKKTISIPVLNAFNSETLKQSYENKSDYDESFNCNNKYGTYNNIEWIFMKYFNNEKKNRLLLLKELNAKELKNIMNISNYLDIHELYQITSKLLMDMIQLCHSVNDLNIILGINKIYSEYEKKQLQLVFEHNKKTEFISEILL